MDSTALWDLPVVIAKLGSVAPPSPDAAASGSDVASGDGEGGLFEALLWLGIIAVAVGQLTATYALRRYRSRLHAFMGLASKRALGLEAEESQPWSARQLMAGIDKQRRTMLGILVTMVLVYSLAAGVAFAYESTGHTLVSIAVSVMMFASLTAPVVLLGVSVANFARLFWVWIAPIAFGSVAMQIVIFKLWATPEDDERLLLTALGGIAMLTIAAVLVRGLTPAAFWRGTRDWLGSHRKTTWGLIAGLVLLAMAGWFLPGTTPAQQVVAASIGAGLAIGGCYVALVDRVKRIVVPLVSLHLFALLFLAALLAMALMGMDWLSNWPWWAVWLACLPLAWLPASFALGWIGLAYEQKVFSDAQFQVFAWMLSIAGAVISIENLVNRVELGDPLPLWLLGATLLSLLGYWLATRYLVTPLGSNKRLLMLRVFSEDERSERLLQEIEYSWRFIGPIVLIGAPDTAALTIDPSKAAQFLRLRLRDTFVPNRRELHKRVAALDEHPDPDGRYRVNELFCFDDLWKDAVQLLLDSSDAVIVDLRGFSALRAGTAYELALLQQRQALDRTVLLVDGSTDMAAVRAALHVPPDQPMLEGNLIHGDSLLQGQVLVRALVGCAGTAPPATRDAEAARLAA
jgi:hypothetical protein